MRLLLRDLPSGLPADALLARIKGRRSFLVHDWEPLLMASHPLAALITAPWRANIAGVRDRETLALQQEYFWVYARMDEELRRSLSPFFWITEVHTLAAATRLLSGGNSNPHHLLEFSLLANPVTQLLRRSKGTESAVAELVTLLASHYHGFSGLIDIYRQGGAGAFERALYDISLQWLNTLKTHPQMHSYGVFLIDHRNLTTIAKHLRWKMATIPSLLPGGSLPLPHLKQLFSSRDRQGVIITAMRLGGQNPSVDMDNLEQVLIAAQSRLMRKMARDPDGVGVILDYLWRCKNESINLRLLTRLKTIGHDAVYGELRK